MRKKEIRTTQVFRINGRMVVANSLEDAIDTWRERMDNAFTNRDIDSITRESNDSCVSDRHDALVYAEGLIDQYVEEIARIEEDRQKMKYELENLRTYCDDLERRNQELQCAVGNG